MSINTSGKINPTPILWLYIKNVKIKYKNITNDVHIKATGIGRVQINKSTSINTVKITTKSYMGLTSVKNSFL